MRRPPPRSTLSSSSAASDVYKRQGSPERFFTAAPRRRPLRRSARPPVSYTHLRAHETPEHLVCRLLLEKKTSENIFSKCTINIGFASNRNTTLSQAGINITRNKPKL